jgi:hypothetical protein
MIAGRYEPLDQEGLARDTELGRVVRIRWVESAAEVDDPRLSHPAVVRVYDIGEHEGRRFAAIEHVQGLLPLALAAPLPADKAVYIGLHAARALAAAHELGLVHAGEILVRDDSVPKLSGFRRGAPGADVRALADALNETSPALPPLRAQTPEELVAELEKIRPTVATQVLTPLPRVRTRRIPVVPILVALAAVAVAVGVIAALRHRASGTQRRQAPRVARVAPVPHAATAEQEARNLAAWLSRYSR